MLCGKCKKNQATKTYEQIKNGKKDLSYYCLSCYHETFLCVDEEPSAQAFSACPYCGTTASEFKKRNLVGCAHCYTMLSSTIFPVVTKMQGGKLHKGKSPYGQKGDAVTHRIRELAILEKKYERERDLISASRCRGQIARLNSGAEEEYEWRNRNSSKRS